MFKDALGAGPSAGDRRMFGPSEDSSLVGTPAVKIIGDVLPTVLTIQGLEGQINVDFTLQDVKKALEQTQGGGFFNDITLIQVEPMSQWGYVESTNPHTIHLNVTGILNAIKSAIETEVRKASAQGIEPAITPQVENRVKFEIARKLAAVLGHERAHALDFQKELWKIITTGRGSVASVPESHGPAAEPAAEGGIARSHWGRGFASNWIGKECKFAAIDLSPLWNALREVVSLYSTLSTEYDNTLATNFIERYNWLLRGWAGVAQARGAESSLPGLDQTTPETLLSSAEKGLNQINASMRAWARLDEISAQKQEQNIGAGTFRPFFYQRRGLAEQVIAVLNKHRAMLSQEAAQRLDALISQIETLAPRQVTAAAGTEEHLPFVDMRIRDLEILFQYYFGDLIEESGDFIRAVEGDLREQWKPQEIIEQPQSIAPPTDQSQTKLPAIPERRPTSEPRKELQEIRERLRQRQNNKAPPASEETPVTETPSTQIAEPSGNDLPQIELLQPEDAVPDIPEGEMRQRGEVVISTLKQFNIDAVLVSVHQSPSATMFEIELGPNMPISRLVGLQNNIASSLGVPNVRTVYPLAGKNTAGIEVPNESGHTVRMRSILESPQFKNIKARGGLPLALGKGMDNQAIIGRLDNTLIAGEDKADCIKAIILNTIIQLRPEEVKILILDVTQELRAFENLPHLFAPIATSANKVFEHLDLAKQEADRRSSLLSNANTQNISAFNRVNPNGKIPYMVIIADEIPGEEIFSRGLDQYRAAGIYVVLTSEHPTLLNNRARATFPSRICFKVENKTESRMVLEQNGGEKLTGKGDMLYIGPGLVNMERAKAINIDKDIDAIVSFYDQQSGQGPSITASWILNNCKYAVEFASGGSKMKTAQICKFAQALGVEEPKMPEEGTGMPSTDNALQYGAEVLHEKAMRLCDQADAEKDPGKRLRLLVKAFYAEGHAADLLRDMKDCEPTRSVLCRSAAQIALDCGSVAGAQRMITQAREGNPPPEIEAELKEIEAKMGGATMSMQAGSWISRNCKFAGDIVVLEAVKAFRVAFSRKTKFASPGGMVAPALETLKADPRWQALRERMAAARTGGGELTDFDFRRILAPIGAEIAKASRENGLDEGELRKAVLRDLGMPSAFTLKKSPSKPYATIPGKPSGIPPMQAGT